MLFAVLARIIWPNGLGKTYVEKDSRNRLLVYSDKQSAKRAARRLKLSATGKYTNYRVVAFSCEGGSFDIALEENEHMSAEL